MTTIVTRKALEFWGGQSPPPELAYVVDGRVVTWAEVNAARRERQARILANKYPVRERRACRVWVAYFDQSLMGGWQAFVDDVRHRTWIDRDGKDYIPQLLAMFPLLLPFGTEYERWERWKVEFAARYRRRRQDGHPVGVAFLWREGRQLIAGQKAKQRGR